MGDWVNNRHARCGPEGRESDDPQFHFLPDMVGKSNLESSITRHSLGHQVRDGSYPLLMAIQNGTTCPVVETMLWGNRDNLLLHTNKFGETALHLALCHAENDHGVTTMLLESSKNAFLVQTKDKKQGNLPIHFAAMRGSYVIIVKQLLRLYPDSIFEKNGAGKTPLDLAVMYGRCKEEIVRLLEISEHHEQL